jgi:hypothetical protein
LVVRSVSLVWILYLALGFQTVDGTACPAMPWTGSGAHDEGVAAAQPSYFVLMNGKLPEVACIVVGPENAPWAEDTRLDKRLKGLGELAQGDTLWRDEGAGGYSDEEIKQHFRTVHGFSRGHLIADSYFRDEEDKMKTYITVNQIPQLQQCNGGWWVTGVEEKVSEFMKAPEHFGARVFVGAHGTAGTPTAGIRHRQFMWTAVCVPGRGFFFVGSNPNAPGCQPRAMDGNNVPPGLDGVISNLQRVCGPSVWAWANLPTTAAPMMLKPTGHFRINDDGSLHRLAFQGSASDRRMRDSAFRIARAKRQYRLGTGGPFHPQTYDDGVTWGQSYRPNRHGVMRPLGVRGHKADKKIYYDAILKKRRDKQLRDSRKKRHEQFDARRKMFMQQREDHSGGGGW